MVIEQNYHSQTQARWHRKLKRDFWHNNSKFDSSDYPKQSPYFDKSNKKVIAKFKDESSVVVFHLLKLHEAKGIKKNIIEQSRSNNKLNKMSFSFIDDKTLRCILNATTQSYEYGRKIHKLKSEEVMTSQHSILVHVFKALLPVSKC